MPPSLVTWDIDGTLLAASGKAGNHAHKRAIDEAVREVHGISITVNDVPHAGSTEMAIIRAMCRKGTVPEERIDERMNDVLRDASVRVRKYIEGNDMSDLVLPGVIDILRELKGRNVKCTLTTGNMEEAAWVKLSAAGIADYFVGGGFGTDAEDRADILRVAIARAGGTDNGDVVHVGDAIADVRAARQVGVGGLGVLTGAYGREELEREQPLAILEDLSDKQQFLLAIGFES